MDLSPSKYRAQANGSQQNRYRAVDLKGAADKPGALACKGYPRQYSHIFGRLRKYGGRRDRRRGSWTSWNKC